MIESNIHIHEIEADLRVGYYRDSLWRFFRDSWKVLEPQTPLVENWHMEYICSQLEDIFYRVLKGEMREQDLIFNVPPATTKSTLITIAFPPWCWITAPHFKILSMSHDASLAMAHAVKSRDIISSEWYQDLFGHIFSLKYDVNKKSEYANDKGGVRIAMGVGQSPVGKHGDLLLCDDPINPEKAMNDEAAIKVNKWWDAQVSTRMTDADVSTKIIVMQRLSQKDLTGHCLKQNPKRYRHICLPAEQSDNIQPPELVEEYEKRDGLLSPQRLNKKVLDEMYIALGSVDYAGQYGQRPGVAGGSILKEKWFREYTPQDLISVQETEGVAPVWDFVIDGALTKDRKNDPTGIMAFSRYFHNLYIRDAESVWMEMPELIVEINAFCLRNGHGKTSRVYIEPKASGHSAEQMLRKYSNLNVRLDKAPTTDKVVRAKGCQPYLESGRAYLLQGAPWRTAFMDQLTVFDNGDHDEYVDLLAMAIDKEERPRGSSIIQISSV